MKEKNQKNNEEELPDFEEIYMTPEQQKMEWSLMGIWNETLEETKSVPKVRDYISAGDIGKSYWARYHKMIGTEETVSKTSRVLRLFSAGNEVHNTLTNVLKSAGILINTQDVLDEDGEIQWSVIPATKDTLKVIGRYDALAGGKPDYAKAKAFIEENDSLSDFMKEKVLVIVERLLKVYPEGMPELLYEFKSLNSKAFWNKKDYLTEAYPFHVFQCYAYLKANKKKEGRILYVSRDDWMMSEFPVFNPSASIEEAFNKDIKEMSYFILNKIEPPKPELVIFKPEKKYSFSHKKVKHFITGCYDFNWEVAWSPYIGLLGYKDEKEYKEKIKLEINDKNDEMKHNFKVKHKLI